MRPKRGTKILISTFLSWMAGANFPTNSATLEVLRKGAISLATYNTRKQAIVEECIEALERRLPLLQSNASGLFCHKYTIYILYLEVGEAGRSRQLDGFK